MKAILGRKIGMTQVFTPEGELIPVTAVETGPCVVTQIKNTDKDGYDAIQVGFVDAKPVSVNKPKAGHFGKAGVTPKRYIREFRVDNVSDYEHGTEILADIFAPGDKIDVTGKSKGKGFAGTIKRFGHARGPMTHGSRHKRKTGSIGAAGQSKVFKGHKMPGRHGNKKTTVQNLEVVRVNADENLILIKGAIPGAKKSIVLIKESVKAK